MNASLIVVAAGSGRRFGGAKQFRHVAGMPLVLHAVRALDALPWAERFLVLPADDDIAARRAELAAHYPRLAEWTLLRGREERALSVLAGVEAATADIVAVHDGVRPFPPIAAARECLRRLAEDPGLAAAIVAAPANDTIKRVGPGDEIAATEDRTALRRAETPQVARRALLAEALRAPGAETARDEAEALERVGHRTACIVHTGWNPKVTAPEDARLVEAHAHSPALPRIGFGYDVHPFDPARPLRLGGVSIPGAPGLAGHSDADALLHALCDALLGAAGLPDIGHFFPNTDPQWQGADSRVLLRAVAARLAEGGWRVGNVDCSVVAEKPKLAPHIAAMKQAIAADLSIAPDAVGVKATTNEKMGFVGRGEGIAAMATALIWRAAA